MRRLAGGREHLDGALEDQATLAGNLRDLARINWLLGGAGLSMRAMRGLLVPTPPAAATAPDILRVLDVGTGAADIPLAMLRVRGPWRGVRVTAVDSRPEVIEAAIAIRPEAGSPRYRSFRKADPIGGRITTHCDHRRKLASATLARSKFRSYASSCQIRF